MVIDGKKIAEDIIGRLKKKGAPAKFMAAFLVGGDPASVSFLKRKEKMAKELGVDFRLYGFPGNMSQDDLRNEILKFAADENCGGIIVQLPLPSGINRDAVLAAVPAEKDVDTLRGNLVLPPAAGVVDEILKATSCKIQDKRAAVVGLGFLVGRPISEWLKGKCAELDCLDMGSDLNSPTGELKQADLVILGTGQAGLIKPEMLKDGALVIDFGYGMKDGKISGDLDVLKIENCKLKIDYTPTPGGTGPILVAKLFENFYNLAE